MRTLKFLVTSILLGPLIGSVAFTIHSIVQFPFRLGEYTEGPGTSLLLYLFGKLITVVFAYPFGVLLSSPCTLVVGLALAALNKSQQKRAAQTPDVTAFAVGLLATVPIALLLSVSGQSNLHKPEWHFDIVWLVVYLVAGGISSVTTHRVALAWTRPNADLQDSSDGGSSVH